ncbi:methyltransferase GidB [Thermodesulfatator indicus DSM 15286]|uniref:Ribosomal RNA small subunit methyltransferase G n=1 Tax=Thermodesulfatator indicus (strain DSM 15286 / JCM 11887 / CIR29812) TaxID=667014 RepID=F8A861_THEID|nr:16S rRNA (guanine(527)-N(7))-methyltransferase RsmG [Thermodesulfatator indicus]AEH45063.1 methyltransferase GidB [Thermodesulfatator indicus DSM 15286]
MSFAEEVQQYLEKGLKELGVSLTPEQAGKIVSFLSLLREFSEPLGLTAIKDPKEIAVKHALDSLSVVRHLPDKGPILDLGTGAGLPGMIIKIARPEQEVWLVDARKKPISFLTYAAGVLGLKDIRIIQATVGRKDPLPRGYFNCVVSRAVSELPLLWELASPLLKREGFLLAMKGPRAGEEIEAFEKKFPETIVDFKEFTLPITGDRRTLVFVKGSPSSGN